MLNSSGFSGGEVHCVQIASLTELSKIQITSRRPQWEAECTAHTPQDKSWSIGVSAHPGALLSIVQVWKQILFLYLRSNPAFCLASQCTRAACV